MGQEILQLATALSHEKNLEIEDVVGALEEALSRVVRHDFGKDWSVRSEISRETGEITYWRYWTFVEELPEEAAEDAEKAAVAEGSEESPGFVEDAHIVLTQAHKDEGKKAGDIIEEVIPNVVLGRVSARLARQFLHQRLREVDARMRLEEFGDKVGEIITGTVKRVGPRGCYIEVKRFELLLRLEDMIPGETAIPGVRMRAVISSIKDDHTGSQVFLSRTSPLFLKGLLAQEVPEVSDGVVEVVDCARDPGSRAKVVVRSHDSSVDPIGSCIGMRGVRIQSVTNELHGEKIDIVQWSDDLAKYLINIFSSADVRRVLIDQDTNRVEVVVSDDSLSLAIGRAGQNIRLARLLLKRKLDLMGESAVEKRNADELKNSVDRIQDKLGVEEMMAHLLVLEGYKKPEDLVTAGSEVVASIEGMDAEIAEELVNRAADSLKQDIVEEKASREVRADLIEALTEDGLEDIVASLKKAKVYSVEDFAWLSVDELLEITNGGVDPNAAAAIIMRLRAPLIEEK
ncbi:MAG: transcription termination factor NusA [Alphaproteobacteria bacterium]|nr:transcription termination factor NusA [Alphaproteobacteria bacterium]